ncbi:MAG: DUF3179 domain-containing protein [Deltaproteobacteria bacterium]|nr:DUF3179 domain-containing protein [Deltaproteobacteria bacterium]
MGQNTRSWILWLTATSLLLQGCIVLKLRPVGKSEEVQREDLPRLKRLEGDRVYSFLGPDRIPAIDEPRFVPASQADFMVEDEAVVGVIHQGQARAYSLWHLDRHEIVNDQLGEDPIAVTW